MIYVDYGTQRRLWKASAHWYREIIASHGATIGNDHEIVSGRALQQQASCGPT